MPAPVTVRAANSARRLRVMAPSVKPSTARPKITLSLGTRLGECAWANALGRTASAADPDAAISTPTHGGSHVSADAGVATANSNADAAESAIVSALRYTVPPCPGAVGVPPPPSIQQERNPEDPQLRSRRDDAVVLMETEPPRSSGNSSASSDATMTNKVSGTPPPGHQGIPTVVHCVSRAEDDLHLIFWGHARARGLRRSAPAASRTGRRSRAPGPDGGRRKNSVTLG